MRHRFLDLAPILDYLGALFWIFGFVMLVPLVVMLLCGRTGYDEVSPLCYVLPAALFVSLGLLLKRRAAFRPLTIRSAMLLCALAWLAISLGWG